MSTTIPNVIVIGGGPCGIIVARSLIRAGLTTRILEGRTPLDTLKRFPRNMLFFSTHEKLELQGIPMGPRGERPHRLDVIRYFSRIAMKEKLPITSGTRVKRIRGRKGRFDLETAKGIFQSQSVVLATGYYDHPNRLGVRGETLSHVDHYFHQGRGFRNREVTVIGMGNSSAEAALELSENGAHVTMIHRGSSMGTHIKPFLLPKLHDRIDREVIRLRLRTTLKRIEKGRIRIQREERPPEWIDCDRVFALIGYHPDTAFFRRSGLHYDSQTGRPLCNPDTLQSNRPGIYYAGAILTGMNGRRVFIENSRGHGRRIGRQIRLSTP